MDSGQSLQYHRKWSRKNLQNISCVSISDEGTWLAMIDTSTLLIFDASNGNMVIKVDSPAPISKVLWLSAYAMVCSCVDGTIITISLLNSCIRVEGTVCKGHPIREIALSASRSQLATGAGGDIRIWRRHATRGTWRGIGMLGPPPCSYVNASAAVAITSIHWLESITNGITQDPTQLVVAYSNHGIQIWDVTTSLVIQTVLNTSVPIGRIALSPDGSQIAVVMQGGIDKIDVPSRRQTLVANTLCGLECPLEFIHGGTVLLSGYGRGVAQLWTLSGDKLQSVAHSAVFPVTNTSSFSDDKRGLFRVVTTSEKKVVLWEAVDAEKSTIEHGVIQHRGEATTTRGVWSISEIILVPLVVGMAAMGYYYMH